MFDTYETRRVQKDREYEKAWQDAPEDFKQRASQLGLAARPESRESRALEYQNNYSSASYQPDMAEAIDTHVDRLVEKYGNQNEEMVRHIAADLRKPMEVECERNRSLMLGRVAMYLVKSETKNILARVHQLLHAIPRLAAANGFTSMRSSARACGVSPEWMKRGRDSWCEVLGIPVPTEGVKSLEAKAAYKHVATTNHWRNRPYHNKQNEPCNQTITKPALKVA